MKEATPTNRFVIDILRSCNYRCVFCYHWHSYDDWKNQTMPLDEVKALIDAGAARGNNYMDITGGEPTIYPYIEEVIEYALSKGVRTCIITNGRVSEAKTKKLLDAGIDGFLVSRHGLEDTFNNLITHSVDAYEKQERFLKQITEVENPPELRFNCVISRFNQEEIYELSKEFSAYNPAIVNFINMNPHKDWMADSLTTQEVVADLRIVEPYLNTAIEHLEENGIGVNVRYYPMCRVAEKYRKTIANDLVVMFDPYEWDYWIGNTLEEVPKTFETHRRWGIDCSNDVEEKGEPCSSCDLQNICGGANKHFHKASNEVFGEVLIPQTLRDRAPKDFYYYRKNNVLTLEER